MTPKPHTCSSCILADTPGCTGFMPAPEGKGLIPLLIIGEALGEAEAKDSLPFRPYADSGSLLERALRSVGIQREQIAITNLIHCRPPGNLLAGQYYEEPAVQHCRQYLDAEVARLKPKAILALGALPFKYLSGFTGRGKQAQDYTRGYPVESVWYPGTPVIGTYHPSYIRRGATELFPVIVHDLHKALMIARGRTKWDTVLDVSYQAGGVAELQWLHELFLRYPDRLIAYDLETRESSTTDEDAYDGLSLDAEIITVQFSWAPGTGMSVPWNEETKPWIQAILALPNPRSGHNCFHRNTSVWMGDGSWKSIAAVKVGEQVRTSRTGEVWHTAPVTNILHTKDLRPWVEVKVDGAYNRGVGRWGNPGVVCTPDHEWILKDGTRVKATDLQPGSEIAVPKLGANDLIFGSLLGDGSVRPDQDQFRCSHTNKAYAYEKAVSLGYADKLKSRSYPGGYKEGTVAWEMTAPIAGYWRSMFYNPDGSRIWNVPISDAALAIWYCDDGCRTSDGAAKIAIHRYSEYRKAILNWSIREFGASSLQTNDDNLYIFTASSARFFERIKAFVPPAMYYKLPRSYQGFYNGWLREPQLQIGRVLSVTPLDKVDVNKYCLEIGGTHTFFTRAGLVSNCWLFDEPQLRAKGITLPQLSMDTMAKWHHLQPDLPANLQFVSSFYGIERPWKHEMAADFVKYGCIDVDAVQRIEGKINQDLAGLRYRNPATGELGISLLEGYNQYVVPLRPILQRMEERGIPRDAEATAELVKYIDAEKERLDAEIQGSCPDAIKPTQTWTSWPLDLSEARKTWAEANPYIPISEKTGKPLKARIPAVKIEDLRLAVTQAAHPVGIGADTMLAKVEELGYKFHPTKQELYKRLPFLPNSTEHLKSYLRHYGVKIPTDLANDETTGRTELDKLMKRLKLITEATGVSKVAPATWTASFTARATKDNFEQLKEAAAAVYEFLGAVLSACTWRRRPRYSQAASRRRRRRRGYAAP
jgi:uracil-DNA glycosylase family 4